MSSNTIFVYLDNDIVLQPVVKTNVTITVNITIPNDGKYKLTHLDDLFTSTFVTVEIKEIKPGHYDKLDLVLFSVSTDVLQLSKGSNIAQIIAQSSN